MKAFLWTVALIVVVTVSPAWAQGEAGIRGEARAAANGSALPGVTVVLTAIPATESFETTTDAEGGFLFQNVRPGEYVLSGASEGFRARELRLVLAPREIRFVPLSLEIAGVAEDVQVIGDATFATSTHSPSSTLLTAERLEALPASQRSGLADALVTLAPGMIRGHDDFVHIRGHEIALNPSINGVSFWENPHAVFSTGLSPEVIEAANVMTGGFSAEYGNRFGGVVDIVTKSGFAMANSGSASATLGQAGRRSLAGEYGGRRGAFGYYLFGSGFQTDRFLSPPDPVAIHDGAHGGRVFAQFDANVTSAGSLRLLVMGDRTDFEIPTTPLDVQIRPLAAVEQRARQQTLIASWSRALADQAISASFYQRASRMHLLPASGPLTAIADLDRDLATIGGKVDATRFAGRHGLKAGVDAVWLRPRETLDYNSKGYIDLTHLLNLPHIHAAGEAIRFVGRDSGTQFSAYVQDGIRFGAGVTADVGVRLDRYDLLVSAVHVSPRANLAFQIGADAVLHASYNNFFVPPAIEGVLSSSAGLTKQIEEIGKAVPALEPTTEHQFEVGVSAPAGPVRLAATGYYRATDNPVHTTIWPDSRIYSYASFDRARAYGLEAKADLPKLNGMTSYLNYALGRVYFYNPVTGGFVTEVEHLTLTNRFQAPMDQTHTLTAGATYVDSRTGLSIGTALEYGSGTPMGHGANHVHGTGGTIVAGPAGASTPRVPGHFTESVSLGVGLFRAGGQRPRLSLQLDIENITNNPYVIAREGEFSAAQFANPRLISATLKMRF